MTTKRPVGERCVNVWTPEQDVTRFARADVDHAGVHALGPWRTESRVIRVHRGVGKVVRGAHILPQSDALRRRHFRLELPVYRSA
jgi:hypothetical protein